MEDYSRFTTPKGQLILNIKPPSANPGSRVSFSPSVPTYPMQPIKEPVPQVKFVESQYAPANNSQSYPFHQNQPSASFNPYANQNMVQKPLYQNPNYQPNQASNLSFHQHIPPLQIAQPHNQVFLPQGRTPTIVPTQTYV